MADGWGPRTRLTARQATWAAVGYAIIGLAFFIAKQLGLGSGDAWLPYVLPFALLAVGYVVVALRLRRRSGR